jgi:circadian clock protein KaiC
MLSPGIDLRPAVKTGNLRFLTVMPEAAGVEQHLLGVLQQIDGFGPAHVVVDAISACHRLGSERAAFDYTVRLTHACKAGEITLITVNQLKRDDAMGDLSGLGVSSLVDTIIVLRYVELTGGVIRVLRVYKNRGSGHSSELHQFRITDDGIDIETVPNAGRPGAAPGPEAGGRAARGSSE